MNAEAVVTIASLLFGGYHLARAAWQRVAVWAPVERWVEDVATAEVFDAPAPPDYGAALAADVDEDGPLTADEWTRLLNDEPDVLPHLAVCGPSGSGKSTFVLALLTRRASHLVICTPKSAADDPWGGFPAVRLTFAEDGEPSFGAIGDAVEAVYREMNKRNADEHRPRTPITLVVDELTSVLYELKARELTAKLIRLWLMGRSVRIRLITMDPTVNVKGWGIEGRGDVRESIGFIRCERDKSAMLGELEEIRNADGVWLDTAEVPAMVAQGLDPARVWRYEPAAPAAMNGAISRYDAANSGATIRLVHSGSTWEDRVRELALEGVSTRKILAQVGGNYNEIVRLAREARSEAA